MKHCVVFALSFCLLLINSEAFSIKPSRIYKQSPESFEVNYSERKIKVDSLITLNSWHLQPVINKKYTTIFISYGDFGNMGDRVLQAATLYDLGYDVVLYDYRGFGGSSDFEMDNDMLFYSEFVADLTAVYEYYKKILPGQRSVFMGMSMGTIVNTVFLAEQELSGQLFVYDGFVASIDRTLAVLEKARKKEIPSPLRDDVYQTCIAHLKNNSGLIFNGSTDKICLLDEDIRSVFEIVDHEGGHLQGFYKLSENGITGSLYNKYIDEFISKNK